MKRDFSDILSEVADTLELYHKVGAEINDIQRLLKCRIKLTGNLFPIAQQVAEMHGMKDETYNARKIAYANTIVRLKEKNRTEGTKLTDSELKAKAEIEVSDLVDDEALAAKGYIQVKLVYDAVKEALSTLNQHIAGLKDEKRASTKQT